MTINGGAVVEPPMSGPIVFPAGPLPRDVWPLVWSYLPVKGLLYASHTCRGWRADLLGNSRLWAQLDLCAYDANEEPGATPPTFSTAETRSNIWLLENIFPRSKSQLITLDVEVRTVATDEDFDVEFFEFLGVLSPQLAVLRVEADDPVFHGEILCDYKYYWTFPVLRVLTLSPSAARKNRLFQGDFTGENMPNLRHFSLHGDFRLGGYDSKWANLTTLHCTVNTILDIERILVSACGLQQLRCECLPSAPYEQKDLHWPNKPIFDALSRVPDIHVAAVLEPASVDWVFDFFVNPPRPRLLVEFVVDDVGDFHWLKLKACAQLSSATHLTMRRGGGNSIIVQPEDGSGRLFQIVLRGLPFVALNPSIDWEFVPALDALTALRVDATLWSAVMCRFPQALLLANVTLVLRRADDIGDLLRDGLVAQVPPGATLTLTAEPITVTPRRLTDLTAALGVKAFSMTDSVEMASPSCRLDVD